MMELQFPKNLEVRDRRRLVESLLGCNCLKNPDERDKVVNDLSVDIRGKIKRNQSPKLDIDEIVRVCWDFSDGPKLLFDSIEYYEGEASETFKKLLKVLKETQSSNQLTENLDAMGQSLASVGLSSNSALDLQKRSEARQQMDDATCLHGQTGDSLMRSKHLEGVMHEINFTRLNAFLNHVDQHYNAGFAALCLVEQSEVMGGYWGLKCVKAWLETAGVQPREIAIQPIDDVAIDAVAIARRLVSEFKVDSGELALKGTSALTKKMCASLHDDCGILIRVQSFGEFSEDTWRWLLREFWCSLLEEFRQKQNLVRARLLIVLQTDSPVDTNSILEHCCDAETVPFDQAKLARLPLDYWTEEELYSWLEKKWGENRTKEKLKDLARELFRSSNKGQPSMIYNLCQKWLVRGVR